ncbi:MAG: ADP-glyceromanno-heptose 6-epimerase [Bacteroidetes bacterium 4572_77]|nr:MAG: ADP-glyceromanno-heptose 6-epimerase [Bacteroidetes bacterium 4572_77]
MIIVTGAAGFIGSALVGALNNAKMKNIVIVDDFSKKEKEKNLANKNYTEKIDRSNLEDWLKVYAKDVHFVLHIGARTDTTEFDKAIFDELNINYSKMLWKNCVAHNIPMIYASSAATYGMGEFGYDDDHAIVPKLKPLNPYGESKNDFDIWALAQTKKPPFWAGLKFFNVYGPNEYHKSRMASVIFHSYNQIKEKGFVNLFKSHRDDYKDGMQLRDFVYVKDVLKVIMFLMENKPASGLYNLGTGKARAFYHLAQATFDALEIKQDIRFVPTPEDIRDKYQYFTEANMKKLREAGYTDDFYSLEEGVSEYVRNYISKENYL